MVRIRPRGDASRAGRCARGGRALLAALLLTWPGAAAALEPVADFGANPGALDLLVHAPASLAPGAPAVVALHGCTQTAADFDDEPGLVALAEAVPLLLLLPQQRPANNEQRCFNFFSEDDNRPGRGESASIRNMVAFAVDAHGVDPQRVFVLGLSAGGAMTAVMLANHPEVFAGGAIFAGTPFDCNRPSFWGRAMWWWLRTYGGDAAAASYACGILGWSTTDRRPADWAAAVRAAAATTPERWPRVSLWHGAGDDVVDPANQRELLEQWTEVHGIDRAPDRTRAEGGVVHEVFADDTGAARLETWRLADFPHAVPIDPAAEPEPCGTAAEFSRPADLCSVRRVAAFWGLVDAASD